MTAGKITGTTGEFQVRVHLPHRELRTTNQWKRAIADFPLVEMFFHDGGEKCKPN